MTEFDHYALTLFKATVKLSAASDTCYILAHDAEDAIQHAHAAYADMNVLYIESVERLAGMIFISREAKAILLEAFGK